jgi:hypothetical protein
MRRASIGSEFYDRMPPVAAATMAYTGLFFG